MDALRRQPLTSAGLLLGVLAALLACFAGGRELVSGPTSALESATTSIDLPAGVIAVFVIAAVLLGAAVAIPATWARLAGIAVLTALATTCGLIVVIARTSDDFAVEADLSLESGGIVLAGAFFVAFLGLVMALCGSRELAPAVDPATLRPGTSGRATAALVLGITGIFAAIAAALAIAFATMGLMEINRSNGVRTGRGPAIAGLVLGIVWLSLWAIFLLLGMFVATPTAD
jgi:hypothetical protein